MKSLVILRLRSFEKGVADGVVVIFVMLACIGIITSFFLSARLNGIESKYQKQKELEKKIDRATKEIDESLMKISPLIKVVEEFKEVDPGEIEKYLKEEKTLYDLKGEDITLEFVCREAAERLTESEVEFWRAQYSKRVSGSREAKLKLSMSEVERKKESEKRRLSNRLNELNFRLKEEETNYTEREDKLDRDKDNLEKEIPRIKREFNKKELKLRNRILFLESTLERLASQEMISRGIIVEPQGEIINADIKNGYAVINLGIQDNLILGLKFGVFRKDKSGIRRWKGQIEVKRILDHSSYVSITRIENPSDPITERDYINNIFYDPKSPRSIVLIGKFARAGFKYDRAEIRRRLIAIGVNIEKRVSMKTDFVIIGKNPEETVIDNENYKVVKKLGIPQLKEETARNSFKYCLGD